MPFFVEIGSCDFDTCLPLAKNGWGGIVCEANHEIFPDVKKMFVGTNVHCMNCAVTDHDGEVEIALAAGWGWAKGISHIVSPNHLGARLCDDPKNENNFKPPVFVQGKTLDTIIDYYTVSEIDFLKIDTEGHELNILKSFSFNVRPRSIKVEHRLTDDLAISEILRQENYLTWTEENDIYAIG